MAYTKNDLQIVISHGQSLAVGAGTISSLSKVPVYPGWVLEAKRDASGTPYFADLVAGPYEQPVISMLNTVQANFIRDGVEGPTLAGAMTGTSGMPLLSLYMSSDNRRTDVAAGLATTASGEFFYAYDAATNNYRTYLNSAGTAVQIRVSDYEPNLFDPVIDSLQSIKAAADAAGYTITDDLVFSFIQGQADPGGAGGVSYAQQMDMLAAKVNAVADAILQKDVNVITVLGQTRYNYPSDQQLKYVGTTANSFLGALEFPYQAEFPAILDWRDGSVLGTAVTHLNEVGYTLLGQETGEVIYGALTGALKEDSYLRIDGLSAQGNTVVLRIAGLKGHLVEDNSIFATEVGTYPPANLGFAFMGGANLSILNAVISGADEVTLTLSGAVTGPLTLSIGNNAGFGGTPLRDSVTAPARNPFGVAPLDQAAIRKFLPTQTLVIDDEGLISNTLEAVSSGSARRTLFGSATDDLILGTTVAERMTGGDGNDTLAGGGGHDLLAGGNGADRFVLSWARLSDTIADFDPGEGDVIDLGDVFAANPEVDAFPDSFLRIAALDADTSLLLIDPDGGGDDFQTVFVLNHAPQVLDLSTLIANGSIQWDHPGTSAQISIAEGNPSGSVVIEVALSRSNDIYAVTGPEDYFIDASAGDDSITGGTGRDQITGGAGNDTIRSGAGDDTLVYGTAANGFDVIDGGAGLNDRIVANASGVTIGFASVTGIEEIYGNGFTNVRIAGSTASNTFDFSAVRMTGIAGIDTGSGDDVVRGSSSDDVIIGGKGNDTLSGNDGDDVFLFGNSAGTDRIDGGAGFDRVEATGANVTVTVTGSNLTSIEAISSGGYAGFKLLGTTSSNTLDYSGVVLTGVTLIGGGSGNDTITGSAGTDFIEGGVGRDVLRGGPGADVFVYKSSLHSKASSNIDLIMDFTPGEDVIDLAVIDANTILSANNVFTFIGTASFTGVAGQLRIDSVSLPGITRVLGDTDGYGGADMEIQLSGTHVLNGSDFLL